MLIVHMKWGLTIKLMIYWTFLNILQSTLQMKDRLSSRNKSTSALSAADVPPVPPLPAQYCPQRDSIHRNTRGKHYLYEHPSFCFLNRFDDKNLGFQTDVGSFKKHSYLV